MLNCKAVAPAFGAMIVVAALVAALPVPAHAQSDSDSAATYRSGVDLGRTLLSSRQCTGSGDYRQGCVDGVQESQFDRQADQAMDSVADESKQDQHIPQLSPPPDMFHDPFSKPGDGTPPNN